jgi:putative metallohydrolase (TIGR04338 family)
LYKAERLHSLWSNNSQFDSLKDVQDWVDKICKSRWFKNRYPRHAYQENKSQFLINKGQGIKVLDGRGRTRANGSTRGFIKLPVWTRSELHILHEIAHVVTSRYTVNNRKLPAFHGRDFCANYLSLVRHFLGKEAGKELKACFKKSRVKYTRPAKTGRM